MGNPNENGSLRKEGSVSVETASLGALGGESQLQLCRELWGAGEGVFGVPQGAVGCRESPPCPRRFHMDPSGTFVQCDARAIGSASEGAQSSLQEVYHKVRAAFGIGGHISWVWGTSPPARIPSFPPQ